MTADEHMTQDVLRNWNDQAPLADEHLAALRRLAETPVEFSTGEHAAVQSRLASAVPELLDEIARLRALLAAR